MIPQMRMATDDIVIAKNAPEMGRNVEWNVRTAIMFASDLPERAGTRSHQRLCGLSERYPRLVGNEGYGVGSSFKCPRCLPDALTSC